MKFADLSAAVKEQLRKLRYDRIVEKHEGPESWETFFRYDHPEFIDIGGHSVLLPIERDQHPNVTILRTFLSDDGQSLCVFLKDTTYVDDPSEEKWSAGFLAICARLPGHDFYVASVYHEWFVLPDFEE